MKLLHCADLHLDAKMTSLFTGEMARERKAELLHTFRRMVEYAVARQVEAVLVAGDLFDTKHVSAAARHTVLDAIAGHPEITFFYLKGNHDGDSFPGNLQKIPDNLKLFGDRWKTYFLGTAGRITVTGVEPFREDGAIPYQELSLDGEKFNIVMLHGQVTLYGTRQDDPYVNLKLLKDKGIDYLALGHVHAYQEAGLDGRGTYCYPGCLEGRGFDECGEHGFVLLHVDEDSGTCTREFVPFAARTVHVLEVDITGCRNTPDIGKKIGQALEEASYSSRCMLKIVLTGNVDVECEKNVEILTQQFAPAYYFLKIQDQSALCVDFHLFAKDESLKGEFVRTVWAADGLGQEEKAAIIRCGIQALGGETI